MIRTTDRIVSPSRATFADALDGLEHAQINYAAGAEPFLTALNYYANRKGIDFAVIASHAANECDLFRDTRFQQRRDAFGIGVTEAGVPGASFATYDDAAFYAVAEYCQKLRLTLTNDEVVRARKINPAKFDRVHTLVASGSFPTVTTIDDLNTPFGDSDYVWMADPDGPHAIVSKAQMLFPNLPDQSPTPTPGGADVTIDIALVNRGFGALTDRTPKVTIHNTGSASNRSQERAFVLSGGGDQGVAYHFATDETGITQIMPLWQRGIHAGNVDGNLTSIAIEMCMNREPWSAVKEHTAQLLAMLHTRDTRLDWSGAEGFTFSLDDTTEHRKWPGANPNCPQRLIATDGGYPALVARAKGIVAGVKPMPAPSKVQPKPIGGETDGTGRTREINGTLWLWVNKMFFLEKDVQAYEYANLAARKGPKFKGGKNIRINYIVSGDGKDGTPELYGTTRLGWRILLKDLI